MWACSSGPAFWACPARSSHKGWGPWRPASRWLTRLALAGAPLSVRDEPSRRLLEGLGLSPVHLTADPVFAAPLPSPERLGARGRSP